MSWTICECVWSSPLTPPQWGDWTPGVSRARWPLTPEGTRGQQGELTFDPGHQRLLFLLVLVSGSLNNRKQLPYKIRASSAGERSSCSVREVKPPLPSFHEQFSSFSYSLTGKHGQWGTTWITYKITHRQTRVKSEEANGGGGGGGGGSSST